MLNQYAGIDLTENPEKFDYFADRFQEIPMFFQTYFGSTEVDKMLAVIEYAIYAYDIGHIVIDNLQFMLSGQARGFDRYEQQDDTISKFRKLATNSNVHITIVIHPRKGEEGQDLTTHSVFGTAKSTQEADNLLILQYRQHYKVVDVKKNRFDGEIGRVSLWFDKGCKRYEQMNTKEIEDLIGGADVAQVLEKRKKISEYDEGILEISQDVEVRSQERQLDKEIISIFGGSSEGQQIDYGIITHKANKYNKPGKTQENYKVTKQAPKEVYQKAKEPVLKGQEKNIFEYKEDIGVGSTSYKTSQENDSYKKFAQNLDGIEIHQQEEGYDIFSELNCGDLVNSKTTMSVDIGENTDKAEENKENVESFKEKLFEPIVTEESNDNSLESTLLGFSSSSSDQISSFYGSASEVPSLSSLIPQARPQVPQSRPSYEQQKRSKISFDLED